MTDKVAATMNYSGAAAAGLMFGLDAGEWTVIFGGVGALCAVGGLTIQLLRFMYDRHK